ncbi:MAG: 4-alpha-glucanotransferase [Clostridia bacterium]|nr:4-alpha-glucanotransferase [Clostridia bacterium]
MERSSGILLHIATLPSEYGIGQLGKSAYKFVDFLHACRQKHWQVLPLVPTGYGDSPYQSCSSVAGNEYFIDLDLLAYEGLLTADEIAECKTSVSSRINYEWLFFTRFNVLKKAYERFDKTDSDFLAFVQKGEYADYALFRALKEHHGHVAWNKWKEEYKFRNEKALNAFKAERESDLLFWQWAQYEFDKQWKALREYANSNGVKIIGDLPIYVAYDSVECWMHPEMVKLDVDLNPIVVAGCPPDAFCETGQLWGNPIYDWEGMKANGFAWWKNRLKKCFELFDTVRIDHFRGFDRYYEIPFGQDTTVNGKWSEGPSSPMFAEIERELGNMEVIAEDLGDLDDSARSMFSKVGYPGMKVLQFAFDSGETNEYLPHNYKNDNSIVYTGTHDNDTLLGNISKLGERRECFVFAVKRELEEMGLELKAEDDNSLCDAIIELSFASKAKLAVIPLQDWLKIGGEGRINIPSSLSTENWSYRIPSNFASTELANKIRLLTEKYDR